MRHTSSHNRTGYIIGLILLFAILGWYSNTYVTYLRKNVEHSEVEQKQIQKIDTDENAKNISPSTENVPTMNDKGLADFTKNVIEKRCPYYKPSGQGYRECLSDWEQELGNKLLPEQQDEVHAYCSTFTAKYAEEDSLEGQELFLKCAIYKFQ